MVAKRNLPSGETLGHAPVMVAEVLESLAVQPGARYVDCTVGGGGHSLAIMEAAAPGGLLLGLDADPEAIERARARLAPYGEAVSLANVNFRDLCSSLWLTPEPSIEIDA